MLALYFIEILEAMRGCLGKGKKESDLELGKKYSGNPEWEG